MLVSLFGAEGLRSERLVCFSHTNDQLAHSTSVVHVLPLLRWRLSKMGKARECTTVEEREAMKRGRLMTKRWGDHRDPEKGEGTGISSGTRGAHLCYQEGLLFCCKSIYKALAQVVSSHDKNVF